MPKVAQLGSDRAGINTPKAMPLTARKCCLCYLLRGILPETLSRSYLIAHSHLSAFAHLHTKTWESILEGPSVSSRFHVVFSDLVLNFGLAA